MFMVGVVAFDGRRIVVVVVVVVEIVIVINREYDGLTKAAFLAAIGFDVAGQGAGVGVVVVIVVGVS